MIDDFRHKGLRKQLVENLREKGIQDNNVLSAILKVPRHYFVENYLDQAAYQDRALPIAVGQTISQPYTVAFQSELLQLKAGQQVLEIGTGSGYQAAVLDTMGAKVYTIERQRQLYAEARERLSKLGYRVQCFYDDGHRGKPTYGPFDKILITAAATHIPRDLLLQLKQNGRMVIPLGKGHRQTMTSIDRIGDSRFERKQHGYFSFVPMLEGVEK